MVRSSLTTNEFHSHLIVANGHNRYPYRPLFAGEETWAGPTRTIFHSTFYSDPAPYAGRTVIVVGNGATGRDHADVTGFS